jgi:hypothetical protein
MPWAGERDLNAPLASTSKITYYNFKVVTDESELFRARNFYQLMWAKLQI